MTIDILFLAKNRLAYTREALSALLANTNWALVQNLHIWDDNSTDGTCGLLREALARSMPATAPAHVMFEVSSGIGSPAGVMNQFARLTVSDVFAKIDNDTIVPPGWLGQCAAVMEAHPELDLLGIEPPESRVPHFAGGKRNPQPENDELNWVVREHYRPGLSPARDPLGYAPCASIGGIGLMRTRCFLNHPPIRPHSIHGGFTEFQEQRADIVKGWICPPLKCFLLDRLPHSPWINLGVEYERRGWQRAWGRYPESAKDLWSWWSPVGSEVTK